MMGAGNSSPPSHFLREPAAGTSLEYQVVDRSLQVASSDSPLPSSNDPPLMAPPYPKIEYGP